ncbi:MAG: hypothetical protein Q8R69_22915 [Telluria sp.]|nr:hypothetical protein [Telluria sp.]
MSNNPVFDTSIPVLTEVLVEKAAEPCGPEALAAWGESEWAALERRLCERIVQQLQGRVDFVLEQRLRDSMADVLQHAITGLTSEIRAGLQNTIDSVVARAVAQELAHLKAHK